MALDSGLLKTALSRLGVAPGAKLALAVSGGADSLALLLLAKDSFDITALTVNHGLRPEAEAEALQVAETCKAFGVPHITLHWQGKKPEANIQAAARDARYHLMAEWCRSNNISFLVTAHHQDDQAETLLLRLARGSGVYGLAGMAATRDLGGVALVRPLLGCSKASLIEFLKSKNQSWIEDPSNQSEAYDRVRIRRLLANPPLEGLRADRLAATAGRMRRSREALEHYEKVWLKRAVEAHAEGYAVLQVSELGSEPEEVVLRGLASLCRFAGRGTYVPRMEKLLRLLSNLKRTGFTGQTLYGAQFTALSDGKTLVTRELSAATEETLLEETCSWDNRFEFSAKGDIAGHEIRALGEEGWNQLRASFNDVEQVMNIPRVVVLTLPAVFKGADLQAVPHLGYSANMDLIVDVVPTRTIF